MELIFRVDLIILDEAAAEQLEGQGEEKDPENPELLTEEGRAIRDFAEENEEEYFSEEYDTDSKEGEE